MKKTESPHGPDSDARKRRLPRVGLVVPGLIHGGGVPAVALWLYRSILASSRYQPVLIDLATSRQDPSSRRLFAPGSWWRGPRLERTTWEGLEVWHAGASWIEWERQRCRPRSVLTEFLSQFDVVQVIAGTPAYVGVARALDRPVLLHFATLAQYERQSLLGRSRGLAALYQRLNLRQMAKLDGQALHRADVVFAMNGRMYEHARALRGDREVIFAPPGVDTDFYTPATGPRAEPCLLSVGRLGDPRKNFRLLFEVYAKLRAEWAACPRLVLVGPGRLSVADANYLRDSGVAATVEIRSDLSQTGLAAQYRNAAILVQTSNEEGFGMVLTEAMASGVPVVGTATDGPRGIVDHEVTGFLTPVGDAAALVARIKQLLSDPVLAQRMGAAGRARAVQRFGQSVAAERFFAVYDRWIRAPESSKLAGITAQAALPGRGGNSRDGDAPPGVIA